jgi:MFS family permease
MPRLLPPLLTLYITTFVASVGFGASIYLLPVYAQDRFAASFVDLGWIGTIRAAPYAILPLAMGYLADRLHRARFYVLALAFNAIAVALLGAARGVSDLLIISAIHGAGYSMFWPLSETLVAELAPDAQRVRAIGRFSVAWGGGFLLGPLLGGLLSERYDFATMFGVAAALVTAGTVLAGGLLLPRYQPLQTLAPARLQFAPSTRSRTTPLLVTIVPYSAVFAVMVTIFPGYANTLGYSPSVIGLFASAFGVTRTVVPFWAPHFERLGPRTTFALIALILAGGYLLLAVAPTFLVLAAANVALGFGLGLVFPLSLGALARHFPRAQLGFAVGLYESVFGLGFAAGPVLGGWLADVARPDTPYYVMSGLSLALIPLVRRWRPATTTP